MTTIPDHVGREAVRLLNEEGATSLWPTEYPSACVRTVAKLLMNPPARMTDPDEEAAKRVLQAAMPKTFGFSKSEIIGATEQMRKEREAWEAGRP